MPFEPKVVEGRVPIYVYAKEVEPEVWAQIERLKDLHFFWGKIVIMPDCHAGKGCVIGFTGYFDDVVVPNIVGVDIGCGVYTYLLDAKEDEFYLRALDAFIKAAVPVGLTFRSKSQAKRLPLSEQDKELLSEIRSVLIKSYGIELNEPLLQVGTLGSGNHFIELGKDEEGKPFEIYRIVRETHCKGHFEKRPITVREWIKEQGLEPYYFFNDLFGEIVFARQRMDRPLSADELDLIYNACYGLEAFLNFVEKNKTAFKKAGSSAPSAGMKNNSSTMFAPSGTLPSAIIWLTE
jgi:hypothetical protein